VNLAYLGELEQARLKVGTLTDNDFLQVLKDQAKLSEER